ncbi:MAG TPA: lyase family protein [Bdellovibrionota bacterium]|nr:lyase family protein [Bdellovibrionota bacterium]
MTLFSPFDTRYAKDLPESLSEEALIEAQVDVELAWLETLAAAKICPTFDVEKVRKIFAGLALAEIEAIEARTQHATRALVEALSVRLQKAGLSELATWVHVGLTSFDTVDTAQRVRLKRFLEKDFAAAARDLETTIRDLGVKHKNTRQVGRTHGQWAVPTFFGLSMMEFAHRLQRARALVDRSAEELCGQASGAIGGYHASAMLSSDPLKLEAEMLKRLELKRDLGSLQIIAPEDQWHLASSLFAYASVVAKVANDLRHLARSEIAEIAEGMAPGQVGSSTMPQKRNPWNLEHVCSLYKLLQSRLQLLQIDLVTEHQRDLTNSASGRFYGEFFATVYLMMKRLTKVLSRIEINAESMTRHMNSAGSSVFAEAFYVALSKEGVANAHSLVREASREAEAAQTELLSVLQDKGYLKNISSVADLEKTVLRGTVQKFDEIAKQLKL